MDDAMDDFPRCPFCGTCNFMDESRLMSWMIIKGDHVVLQGFSLMMPRMIIRGDHVDVQRFSWMMPWMSIQDDHVAVHASSWMNGG